jgi:hypothetical protein
MQGFICPGKRDQLHTMAGVQEHTFGEAARVVLERCREPLAPRCINIPNRCAGNHQALQLLAAISESPAGSAGDGTQARESSMSEGGSKPQP